MRVMQQKQGFTLVEMMVTATLSFLVFATLFSVYYWGANLSSLCGKKNRSQVAATHSSIRVMELIRNATRINGITEDGRGVELAYSDGTIGFLAYTNSPDGSSDGALGFFRAGQDPIWLVQNGITELMSYQGHDSRVFNVSTNYLPDRVQEANILFVRYRVSQPADEISGRELDDKNYAMHVRFAACLRNMPAN